MCLFSLAICFILAGCDPAVEEPPDLTGTVTINNTSPKVGDTLTATYSAGNGTGVASWQWYRDNDLIGGATANTYTVVAADLGLSLKAQVSYKDQKGVVISAATAVVAAAPVVQKPTLTGTVTIDNTTPKVGNTLTATYSGNGTGTILWQWVRGRESIIRDATSDTYTVVRADAGLTLSVFISTENQRGYVFSEYTKIVAAN